MDNRQGIVFDEIPEAINFSLNLLPRVTPCVEVHPHRENILAVSLDERRAMIREALVKLESLWPRDDDSSQCPINEKALILLICSVCR